MGTGGRPHQRERGVVGDGFTARLPRGYRTVIAWLPHGYRTVTAWLPRGYRTVTAWLPHDYCMVTAGLTHDYRTITARLPHGYRTITAQLPQGRRTGTARVPHGYHTGTARVPHGYRTGTTRVPHGYHTGTTQVPHGYRTDPRLPHVYRKADCKNSLHLKHELTQNAGGGISGGGEGLIQGMHADDDYRTVTARLPHNCRRKTGRTSYGRSSTVHTTQGAV